MFFMTLGAMPFTCQGSKEDVRDASCLIEPDPAQPQGLPDDNSLELQTLLYEEYASGKDPSA
jgi:hypothetical protein